MVMAARSPVGPKLDEPSRDARQLEWPIRTSTLESVAWLALWASPSKRSGQPHATRAFLDSEDAPAGLVDLDCVAS
eukprot:scaffold30546_cov34-Tisochrysis_lutea.AAC.2